MLTFELDSQNIVLVGPFISRQCLVEGDEVLPDRAGVAAKEVAYQLVEHVSLAGAGAELPCSAADRATAPEVRIRVGAHRAQRHIPGAAADVVDGATAAAWCPPQLAPVAPAFVRDTGNLTDRCPSADAALGGSPWPAVGATGPVGKADGDFLATPTAAAFLQVDGVADEAVGAERVPFGIPDGGLADDSAANARHGRVAGEAVAADPFARDTTVGDLFLCEKGSSR